VFVLVANGDLSIRHVNPHVERLIEGGSSLKEMVADQLKVSAL
jgi:hypothetical protein